MRYLTIFPILLLSWAAVSAQTAYVTDQFEITLRSGPSTQNTILRMLASGAQVEILETDAESGYSHVRTASGVDGWVLTRYLMDDPAARDQVAAMRQQVSNLRKQLQDLGANLEQRTASGEELQQEKEALLARNRALDEELQNIRRISANALNLDRQNQELSEKIQALNHRVQTLTAETQDLQNRRNRDWFVAGAGVLLIGIILGLILPRLRSRRRSSWSDF